jgi:tripartite-type tricarboxylate transporter receptor subunit TctC
MDRRSFCSSLAALAAAPALANVPAWPSKPLRIIAGGTGSVTDLRARWLADRLAAQLGQPVMVENKSGAGGVLAMEAGARSAPDGYTIVVVHQGTVAANPHLYASLPYDPFRDFAPITRLGVGSLVMAVNPALGVRTLAEFRALARSRSRPLAFGSPGIGTPPHLATELFKREAGVAADHIPYKTGGQAASDLIGGHVDFSIEGITVLRQHVESGRVVALATTSAERVASMPTVPTMHEAGLPGFVFIGWVGLAVPAATPKAIVDRLYEAVARVLDTAEAKAWFALSGADPGVIPPAEFAAFMRAESDRLGRLIREAGIRAE